MIFKQLYDFAEEIMVTKIAEVINLLFISDSKISVEKQSTLSMQTFLFDNFCVLTLSL